MKLFLGEKVDQQNIQSTKSFLEIIIEYISRFKDYFDLIKFVFVGILFLITILILFNYRKRVNNKSKKEYTKNEKNGKFISDLYVELGNSNEKLRYMYNSYFWTWRIRKEFYKLLHTNLGKMMAKRINIKIYNYLTKRGLYKSLKKCQSFLEKCRKYELNDEKNFMYYLSNNSFYLIDDIERLLDNMRLSNTNVCFLLGKAGSGKTNLLTNFAQKIINNYSKTCIYIDSKDVEDNDIENKFLSYFDSSLILTENKHLLISLLLFIKKIFKIKIVVIVEAINENSNLNFYKNLCRFINKYHKYKNIKIIISSRTEFYNIKFKKIFDEYLEEDVKYEIISIETSKLSNSILEKMFDKYSKYFNFNGSVNQNVRYLLYDSPILMRIFFECYKNSNDVICNIDKSKLFSEYIANLTKKYPNLKKILKEITIYMINNDKFDYIDINKITVDFSNIENLIYENVLLTKSIIENEGKINEEKIETIAITYDEIRDYLISNQLIEMDKKSKIDIIKYIDKMIECNFPIVEGVLKNLYCYYKNENNKICKHILNIESLKNYNFGNRDMFINAHLDFIFSSKQELLDFELKYLNELNYIVPKDLFRLILVGISNSIHLIKPGDDFILNKINSFINDGERTFDFSRIDVDCYEEIVKNLEKYSGENIIFLKEKLLNLIKYLENDYENK